MTVCNNENQNNVLLTPGHDDDEKKANKLKAEWKTKYSIALHNKHLTVRAPHAHFEQHFKSTSGPRSAIDTARPPIELALVVG